MLLARRFVQQLWARSCAASKGRIPLGRTCFEAATCSDLTPLLQFDFRDILVPAHKLSDAVLSRGIGDAIGVGRETAANN